METLQAIGILALIFVLVAATAIALVAAVVSTYRTIDRNIQAGKARVRKAPRGSLMHTAIRKVP